MYASKFQKLHIHDKRAVLQYFVKVEYPSALILRLPKSPRWPIVLVGWRLPSVMHCPFTSSQSWPKLPISATPLFSARMANAKCKWLLLSWARIYLTEICICQYYQNKLTLSTNVGCCYVKPTIGFHFVVKLTVVYNGACIKFTLENPIFSMITHVTLIYINGVRIDGLTCIRLKTCGCFETLVLQDQETSPHFDPW